jgi:chromosome partitioning protein
MPKVIAIVSQKGGVGKTTTAANLGASLAQEGQRVLIAEIDPQGGLAESLGVRATPAPQNPEGDEAAPDLQGLAEVLRSWAPLAEVCYETSVEGLRLLPAGTPDPEIESRLDRAARKDLFFLKHLLDELFEDFDYVLLDAPAGLGHLPRACLAAADSYLVPLQAEDLSYRTLPRLDAVVQEIRETANPDLVCEGILLTMVDLRTRLARKVVNCLYENHGDRIMVSMIPRTIRVQEMVGRGKPSVVHAPRSKGALAYTEVAREVLLHGPGDPQAEADALADIAGDDPAPRRVGNLAGSNVDPYFESLEALEHELHPAPRTWSDTIDREGGWLDEDDELTVN